MDVPNSCSEKLNMKIDIKNKLLAIINDILDSQGLEIKKTLNKNTKLREDLGFDSLDLAELTVKIESEFDIDIFENEIINTVEEIYSILKN